jgi:hypothetical protein
MSERLSNETWRRLREEARGAAAEAERQTRAAAETADLPRLHQLEQRLGALNEAWAVHEKSLVTRIPIIGPVLAWLGTRLARFLLQHQVTFNSESARLLQELYQAQRLLASEQVDRADDLFSRLDERLLSLEARLEDLEEEVRRLRERP